MKTIKAAVAGIGFIGAAHVEALRRLPYMEVAAMVGSDPEKAKRKAEELGIPSWTADLQEVLDRPDIDAVHICTPNHLHYEMCKAVLLAGKHVVCEKPLTLTVEEALELQELADRNQLVHAICFNIRYNPLIQHAQELIQSGKLGKIFSISGSYLQDWLFHETDFNWRVESSKAGSSRAMADIGSHWMDLMEFVSGQSITAVFADFATVHPTRLKPLSAVETYTGKLTGGSKPETERVEVDTEDLANVLFRYGNGARGAFTVSQVHAGRKNQLSFEIAGTEGVLAWNSENPNEMWLGNRESVNGQLIKDPSLLTDQGRRFADYPGGHAEGFPDTFKQLFKEVYRAVRESSGGKAAERKFPTFAAGIREQILCDKVAESNKCQAWVTID